jgi:hypothetical protein
MKEFMLVFIAIEIFICSLGIAFFSSSEKDQNYIKYLLSMNNKRDYSLSIYGQIFENVPCVKKEYEKFFKIKYFQNDSIPLAFGSLFIKVLNTDREKKWTGNIFVRDQSGKIVRLQGRDRIPIEDVYKINSEYLQTKILENCIKNDSVILIGEESNKVANTFLRSDYSDTMVIFFHRNEKREENIYLNSIDFDSTCRKQNLVHLELLRLGNGLVRFMVTTKGSSYGMEKIKLLHEWRNSYIPILELCDECTFHQIDSNLCELTGIIETTKDRVDVLFNFRKPQFQFYAYPPNEETKKVAQTDLCYEKKDKIDRLKNIDKEIHYSKN